MIGMGKGCLYSIHNVGAMRKRMWPMSDVCVTAIPSSDVYLVSYATVCFNDGIEGLISLLLSAFSCMLVV